MARIKDLLDPEVREKAYALKDTLQYERILGQDFLRMNRTQFTHYLRAHMWPRQSRSRWHNGPAYRACLSTPAMNGIPGQNALEQG